MLAADVDESVRSGELADTYVLRVAGDKAAAVLDVAAGRLVLAADTTVLVDGQILGKPSDASDARRMLRLLSGRRHHVLTAVVLADQGRPPRSHAEVTIVEFAKLHEGEVAAYVASGEPMGKAGAYAIQGLASRFVQRIEGSYTNVVGLPVARVFAMAQEFGDVARFAGPHPDHVDPA